jgi:hypothetical protein
MEEPCPLPSFSQLRAEALNLIKPKPVFLKNEQKLRVA